MKKDHNVSAKGLVWKTRLRKSASGVNAVFATLLALLLWAMVNYLSMRHYQREDWSSQQLSVLAPQTEEVLDALDRPVRMIAFTGREHRGRDLMEELLREYAIRSRKVRIEFVDPDRDLGQSKDLQLMFGLAQADVLLLVSGDRHETLSMDDMVILQSDEERAMGQEPKMTGFQGEAMITSALMRLVGDTQPVVYFLTGHGESDIDLFEEDRRALSEVRQHLERDNILVQPLRLEETRGIPADASAVVIAGPTQRIPQPDLDTIRAYLEDNGRLMVLLNPLQDAGLEPMLRAWGIQLLQDVVVDPTATISGSDVHITRYADHPVTRNLQGLRTILIRPRSVWPVNNGERPDQIRYTPLMVSSEQSWAEMDLTEVPIRFDPAVDIRGPVPLAAAVERGGGGDLDLSDATSRLIVIGDADFASNWLNSGTGMLLFRNSVNWLVGRDRMISLPPMPVEEIRLMMDQRGLNRLLLWVAVLMPGSVAALGMLVALRRRG
jgi:ABC-type uncharacterized transport system involved in gliding motility auxiliary subunit